MSAQRTIRVVAAVVERDGKYLITQRRPTAVLLGAEGPGLSAAALDAVDTVVTIPMAEGIDSLNVATAAAVVLERLSGP